ncbi:MAG: CotH kinase family protein [Kiritimatiellae bacterium]|nr:CotH kinase family protein [Kiritimatiellia bacterium]
MRLASHNRVSCPMRRNGAGKAAILAVAAIVVVAMAFTAPRVLFWTQRISDRFDRRLGARLLSRHGLVFLADLNRSQPIDRVGFATIDVQDAPRVFVSSRTGRCLRATGNSFLSPRPTGIHVSSSSATYAIEVAPDDTDRPQELVNAMGSRSGMSLLLERGTLRLLLKGDGFESSASASYEAPSGAFTHIAVTVSQDAALLYQNGRECASVTLPSPVTLQPRQWLFSNASRNPLLGIVGSLAIWNRPLSAHEVRRLAALRGPLAPRLEPACFMVAASLRFCDHFLRATFRVLDRLVPSRMGAATLNADAPILTLRMRKGDERHFVKAHEKSLFNGYRTRSAARAREIDVIFKGKRHCASAWLDDQYSGGESARRPAFVVAGEGPAPFGATGVARLYPPELHGHFHADAPCVVPLNGTLVRLYVNSSFRGIYVVEPIDAPGSAWMERGALSPGALYFGGAPKPADILPNGVSQGAALRRVAALFRSDCMFPWSASELMARGRIVAGKAAEVARQRPPGNRPTYFPQKRHRLPVLSISVMSPVEKVRRRDFTFTVFTPEGDAISAHGLAGFGGGLRHRGNTSYLKGVKRSLSLKFDAPLPWPDPNLPTTHILLHNGYADPTRLRNKISFDFYHSAASACGRPDLPAPSFSHVELFFNGEYFGIWETCGRARDLVPPDWPLFKVRGINNSIWRTSDTSMLDCLTSRPDDPDPYLPIRELFQWTSSAPEGVFSSTLETCLDMENLACYWLLLNFSHNNDGRTMNQYFAVNQSTGRTLVIPWDYDKTFLGRTPARLSNHLLSRILNERPDFTDTLRRIWHSLRSGPWSDEAVSNRIDADAAMLAPCMADEWRLLQPAGFNGSFDDAVRQLRSSVQMQLDFLDGVLGNEQKEERTSGASQP